MQRFECPYYDECGLLCDQTNENCRIKELFEDFYKVEKLYTEANAKCERLKQENEDLKARNSRGTLAFLEEDFKKEQKIKKYKQCLDEIEKICKVNAINTCWTALNLCDKCKEKEECGLQSPLAKLDAISNIIKQEKESE